MISAFISVDVQELLGADWPLIAYLGHGDLWLIFFLLGIWLKRSEIRPRLSWVCIAVIASFALQLIEGWYFYNYYSGGFGYKPSSVLFASSAVLLVLHPQVIQKFVSSVNHKNWCSKIGVYSFGIYLIHRYVISMILATPMRDYNWMIQWFIVLLFSYITVCVGHKLLPSRINRIIGF